jgi:hypothetical protein
MRSTTLLRAVLISLLLAGGCVVGAQLTPFTIHPHRSADLVVFRSNLRSTEKGDKAANELADYKTKFEARTEDELLRIREAGGAILETSWVREQVPLSNLAHAQFPNASAFEKFLTIKNEDGSSQIETHFRSDGARRSLTVQVSLPASKANPSESPLSDAEQLTQALANGISETRIALTGGAITTARGFTVASDKQSALLNICAIDEIIHTGGNGKRYLEWEVVF